MQQTRHRGDGSAPTGSTSAVEDISRSPAIPPARAETPCALAFPDEASHDTPVPSLTRSQGFDENQPACRTASIPDHGEQCSFFNVSVEKRDDERLVARFGSAPATFSSEYSGIRRHVRPGSLRNGQVARPTIIQTCSGYMAECEGRTYLVSTVVDRHPSGSKFNNPSDLDLCIGENEHHTDVTARVDLEMYTAILRQSFKVSCSVWCRKRYSIRPSVVFKSSAALG